MPRAGRRSKSQNGLRPILRTLLPIRLDMRNGASSILPCEACDKLLRIMDAAPGVRAAPPEPTMSAATTQAIAQPEQVAIPRDQTTVTAPPQRNVAVDAYRGLVMV